MTMSHEITIRTMTPADFAPLAAWMVSVPLWQRYGLTVERAVANFAAAAQQGEVLLVADRGTLSACGFAWIVPKGAFGRSAYLRLIGVQPTLTGSGLGGVLLAYAEQVAQQHGNALFLLVSDFNVAAQRFYQRHGYTQIGAIAGYVVAEVVELLFWKRFGA